MRWTWYTPEVDYNFFAFKSFRQKYLFQLQAFFVLFVIFPVFLRYYQNYSRLAAQEGKISITQSLERKENDLFN